jgi:hypothetical protein
MLKRRAAKQASSFHLDQSLTQKDLKVSSPVAQVDSQVVLEDSQVAPVDSRAVPVDSLADLADSQEALADFQEALVDIRVDLVDSRVGLVDSLDKVASTLDKVLSAQFLSQVKKVYFFLFYVNYAFIYLYGSFLKCVVNRINQSNDNDFYNIKLLLIKTHSAANFCVAQQFICVCKNQIL